MYHNPYYAVPLLCGASFPQLLCDTNSLEEAQILCGMSAPSQFEAQIEINASVLMSLQVGPKKLKFMQNMVNDNNSGMTV